MTLSQNVCKNEKRGIHHESENRKQISERSRVDQAYCTGQKDVLAYLSAEL